MSITKDETNPNECLWAHIESLIREKETKKRYDTKEELSDAIYDVCKEVTDMLWNETEHPAWSKETVIGKLTAVHYLSHYLDIEGHPILIWDYYNAICADRSSVPANKLTTISVELAKIIMDLAKEMLIAHYDNLDKLGSTTTLYKHLLAISGKFERPIEVVCKNRQDDIELRLYIQQCKRGIINKKVLGHIVHKYAEAEIESQDSFVTASRNNAIVRILDIKAIFKLLVSQFNLKMTETEFKSRIKEEIDRLSEHE